jgi:hypothetical protein
MKEPRTKYEVLEMVKELRNLQFDELENLGKSMMLEDMFPDKPFPVKIEVSGGNIEKPYELATAYFTFADGSVENIKLMEVSKKLWPQELINQFNKDEKRKSIDR